MSRFFHHISCLLALTLSGFFVQAQQDALYTQYQFNKLPINPAYAGSRDGFSMNLHYRDQWQGIDGSPTTINMALHAPIGDRIGLGFQLIEDRLGIVEETGAWGNFAFRFPAGSGELAIGLQGGLSYYRTSLDGGFIVDTDDPVLVSDQTLWLPNVGAGIYYHTDRFYVGVAAPRLIDNELNATSSSASGAQSAKQFKHYNAMTGVVFDAGSEVKIRPAILARYVEGAPILLESSVSALFIDKFWLGAAYRSSGSWDFLMEYQITPIFRFGYSYDLVVNEIASYVNGSHEIMFGIDLGSKDPPVMSPRHSVPNYF
jgi:type IX secretion system PorP/SprF family membrane protein